ncbi:hypothetical protein G7046_g7497 [Stylonectria norvegica]|nr:hypothetical protein G7046_g7497 [Stylonectria norvegica]
MPVVYQGGQAARRAVTSPDRRVYPSLARLPRWLLELDGVVEPSYFTLKCYLPIVLQCGHTGHDMSSLRLWVAIDRAGIIGRTSWNGDDHDDASARQGLTSRYLSIPKLRADHSLALALAVALGHSPDARPNHTVKGAARDSHDLSLSTFHV